MLTLKQKLFRFRVKTDAFSLLASTQMPFSVFTLKQRLFSFTLKTEGFFVSTLKQRLYRFRIKIGAFAVFTLKQAKHEHTLKLIDNYTQTSKGVINFSPFLRANRLRQNGPKRFASTKHLFCHCQ